MCMVARPIVLVVNPVDKLQKGLLLKRNRGHGHPSAGNMGSELSREPGLEPGAVLWARVQQQAEVERNLSENRTGHKMMNRVSGVRNVRMLPRCVPTAERTRK